MVAAGGNATFSQLVGGNRHQPPVPQPSRTRRRSPSRQQSRLPRSKHPTRQVHDEEPDHISEIAPSFPARRRRRAGAAVDGVAAPFARAGRRAAARRRRSQQAARCASPASTFRTASIPTHWWAKGSGAAMEFGPAAEPLTPIREDLVFVRGLYNQTAFSLHQPAPGPHGNMLSGAKVSLDPSDIRVGATMDQVLAQQIGHQHRGAQHGARHRAQRAASGRRPLDDLRLQHLVGHSPTKPATKEIYPARTFDQLVGDGKGRKLDRSILDAVLQDTHDLQPKISTGDRKKLDEYLESVRDIEKRIDRAGEGGAPRRLAADARRKPNMPRPGGRDSAERAGPHEADARSDRARLPDGQDAHRHLHAEQRPLADELQVHRGRARRAAPRPDAQRQDARTARRCTSRPTSSTCSSSPTW